MGELPLAVNCSILFTELPLLERPAAVRAAGFDAVEFWWPFPDAAPTDPEVDAFVEAIESAGVALIALNFAAGDLPAGDRGLLSWPGRESEFFDSVQVAVGISERLGTRAFNALYGNRIEGVDPAAQDELATENLVRAARQVAPLGGVVLLEAVSGAPRYPLRTGVEVVAAIERVEDAGASDVRLLADLYHLAVNGDNVEATIHDHGARIGHVQVADAPGRHRPGTGELALEKQLAAIAATGYRGHVALEYVPLEPSATDLAALDLHVSVD
ncbi:MAG: TIM barrel protein [Acidimicrobiaceae bacterium]|nr:TIM barrel protein [Acidimicrobiaceae bacterium]